MGEASRALPVTSASSSRVRASEPAITAALKALRQAGMSVGCTQYEIMAIHGHSEAKAARFPSRDL
jgi:hypothetical protein